MNRVRTFGLAIAFLGALGVLAVRSDRVHAQAIGVQAMRDAHEARAMEVALAAARSPRAELRANAIEALQHRATAAQPVVMMAVDDPSAAVRFAALVTGGKLKLPAIEGPARRRVGDPNLSVRAAALFALRQVEPGTQISPLAQLMSQPDPGVRANVAMLLGMMGDASAAPMIKELSQLPMPRASEVRAALMRVQVAEAVATLGDDLALDAIRSAMYSTFDEVRVLAVLTLGRLKDKRMEPALVKMLAEPPVELQLAAAEALARTGNTRGLDVVLGATAHALPTVRMQAAFALRWFGDPRATEHLVKLLEDPEEAVRLAAAAVILAPAAGQ